MSDLPAVNENKSEFICKDTNFRLEFYQESNAFFQVLKVIHIETEYTYVIAKDSMGTQICKDGQFYPSFGDFGEIQTAVNFLNSGETGLWQDAMEFFKGNRGSPYGLNFNQIMLALANKSH